MDKKRRTIVEKFEKYLDNKSLNEETMFKYVRHSFTKIAEIVSSRIGQYPVKEEDFEEVLEMAEDMGNSAADELKSALKSSFDGKGTNINKSFEKKEIDKIYKSFIKGMKKGLR